MEKKEFVHFFFSEKGNKPTTKFTEGISNYWHLRNNKDIRINKQKNNNKTREKEEKRREKKDFHRLELF